MHHIADAVDVDDDGVLAVAVDDALELADHRTATFSSTLARWCACVTAIASASAASSDCGSAFGSSTPIIMRICAFSAWPAPTMVFFTRFGAYSATRTAGLRRHQQRDAARLAELQRRGRVAVDEGRLDRRLVGPEFVDDAREPVMDRHQPLGQRQLVVGLDRTAGQVDQPVALAGDQAPAGAAEARIDAEDANRLCHRGPLIAPRAASRAPARQRLPRRDRP